MLKQLARPAAKIQQTTIRDFGGGLNVVDNDLNLNSRYATALVNMYRGQDGTQAIRYGTTFFTSLRDIGINDIVGMQYYNSTLVVVDRTGLVASVRGDGVATIIFNDALAGLLPGNPSGWSNPTDYVSFAEFNGVLIACNGQNTPLTIYPDNSCEYMNDLADGSNDNVPRARNVSVHNQYVVMSGDASDPSTLFIGATSTLGTFQGDPDSDGVNIDLGPYVRIGSPDIRGHTSFRDKLVIFFDDMVLTGTLGIFDADGVHTPSFADAIEQIGAINTNTARPIGDDVFFCGYNTISSLTRALFTGQVKPETPSALIDPLIMQALANLNETALANRVFSAYNESENQYMLFIPNGNTKETTDETYCFVYTIARQSKDRPWALFRGWNWSCATHSALGRLFFARDGEIFYYGNTIDEFFGDYIGYEDTWSDGTIFDDGHGWEIDEGYDTSLRTGVPIRFDWLTPWADFDKRLFNKKSLYVGLDTTGNASYTLDMFVDNIVVDRSSLGEPFSDDTLFTDDTGWTPQTEVTYLPALTMEFTAAGESGYGAGPYGYMPFGGGRPTPYEQLYAWPAKCNIAKFRIHGETKDKLHVVSLTILFTVGSIRR